MYNCSMNNKTKRLFIQNIGVCFVIGKITDDGGKTCLSRSKTHNYLFQRILLKAAIQCINKVIISDVLNELIVVIIISTDKV